MSKKVLILLLGLICVIGGVLSVFLYSKTDREGPKIQLSTGSMLYHKNDDVSILLEGVTAVDDVDGDVTDSLIVEAIYPSADETKAKIVYAAMDRSNNVTKKQRIVDYTSEDSVEAGAGGTSATETGDVPAAGENGTGESAGNVGTAVTTPTIEPDGGNEANGTLQYADADIAIVNGSGVAGVAGVWKQYLTNAGYTAIRTGSYKAEPEDTIIYTEDEELAEELMQYFPNASVEERMPVEDVDISLDSMDACVVVGPQYAEVPET